MKYTIKLCFFLSGLMLLQACVTNNGRSNIPTDLYHSVQSRGDVATISNSYGCRDHIELANINQIPPPYLVYPGQTLRIPADICGVAQTYPTTPSSSTDYYIARKGDTLYSISKAYNVSLSNLASWNSLEPPFTLSIGQQIKTTTPIRNEIQTSGYNASSTRKSLKSRSRAVGYNTSSTQKSRSRVIGYNTSSTRKSFKSRSHVVIKGENLYRISMKYGYSVANIARWNRLSKPYILSVGQRLRLTSP